MQKALKKGVSSCAKIYFTKMIKLISQIADVGLYPLWAHTDCENMIAFLGRFLLPVHLFKLWDERKMKILFHFLPISILTVYESVSVMIDQLTFITTILYLNSLCFAHIHPALSFFPFSQKEALENHVYYLLADKSSIHVLKDSPSVYFIHFKTWVAS